MAETTTQLHVCDWGATWQECADRQKYFTQCGIAIDLCYEDEAGQLWVENGEYGNRVNYCPFCGYKAPQQMSPE